jgi:hypothetical protein
MGPISMFPSRHNHFRNLINQTLLNFRMRHLKGVNRLYTDSLLFERRFSTKIHGLIERFFIIANLLLL